MASPQSFQAPTGTRDIYPADANRRRYINEAWRAASIRHGFEEIDGPTFEHLDTYTVKSGEAIVSELFSFQRAGGEKTYALRPEFTPTLARLYAARAGSLPKPTRWFTSGPMFRAERPQRGRLREFLQWNCDILGDPSAQADAEIIAACIGLLEQMGLTPADCRVRTSNRYLIRDLSLHCGLPEEKLEAWLAYLDGETKRSEKENAEFLVHRGVPLHVRDNFNALLDRVKSITDPTEFNAGAFGLKLETIERHAEMLTHLQRMGCLDWCQPPLDLRVVRGLAYYTGMVFEVHEISGGERALAGGGRYDNLIELFGGPPTPAVGFGMGDVVLGLVLQDRGLMPSDAILAERAGGRPDVFVISNGTPEADLALPGVLAALRQQTPTLRGLHARRTGKSTKNIGKLLQEAAGLRARCAMILESGESATLKNLETGVQIAMPIAAAIAQLRG
ncbi:MAG: histidine--tRNA ligase [Planctomycetota bacterium]